MYARRPFSGSSSSNTGSGSSTDTKAPTGNLKKTLFKTFEGQQFVTYNLEVENAAGWVMRNQLSDVMYSGGLRRKGGNMYAKRPFSGSTLLSSNPGNGSSTDTNPATGTLKKTLYKTHEGQEFAKQGGGVVLRLPVIVTSWKRS